MIDGTDRRKIYKWFNKANQYQIISSSHPYLLSQSGLHTGILADRLRDTIGIRAYANEDTCRYEAGYIMYIHTTRTDPPAPARCSSGCEQGKLDGFVSGSECVA